MLIYEMAAGYPPFFADQPIQIYEKIVSGKVNKSLLLENIVMKNCFAMRKLNCGLGCINGSQKKFGNIKKNFASIFNWFTEEN